MTRRGGRRLRNPWNCGLERRLESSTRYELSSEVYCVVMAAKTK